MRTPIVSTASTASIASTDRVLELAEGQLLHLGPARGCIRVMDGLAWLTESGDLRDTVLAAGGVWPLRGEPVVLAALAATRLQVCDEAPGLRGRAALRWRQAARRLQQRVQRLQFGPVVPASD